MFSWKIDWKTNGIAIVGAILGLFLIWGPQEYKEKIKDSIPKVTLLLLAAGFKMAKDGGTQ